MDSSLRHALQAQRNPKGIFVRTAEQAVGRGYHRSGWPYAFSCLLDELSGIKAPIAFDDFVEQTYAYGESPKTIYSKRWVGIFHHPPDMPAWATDNEKPEVYMQTRAFRLSASRLRLAIALSDHLAEWLRQRLQCPVVSIRHPCQDSERKWRGSDKQLLQIGWYLRNVRLIHQTRASGWRRMRLIGSAPWQIEWDYRCRGRGKEYPGVDDLGYVSPDQYDELLLSSVVIQQAYAASACNGILDCIVRQTPVIVNRHPSVIEYLGARYPLFWDSPSEIPRLLDRAEEGHEYLRRLRAPWLDGKVFACSVRDAIERVL